jgi:anthranilate synthase/aminodeoxychorismate synthase-like glutamine amidotransferase
MILVLDNYDSFTFNLVQALGALGADPTVLRNDERTVEEIRAMAPDRIVVSPGPCTPGEAGVSVELIRALGPTVPTLGVCLGHQAIGEAFGGRTVRARRGS